MWKIFKLWELQIKYHATIVFMFGKVLLRKNCFKNKLIFFRKGSIFEYSMEWNIGFIQLRKRLYSTGLRPHWIRHWIERLFKFECVRSAIMWHNCHSIFFHHHLWANILWKFDDKNFEIRGNSCSSACSYWNRNVSLRNRLNFITRWMLICFFLSEFLILFINIAEYRILLRLFQHKSKKESIQSIGLVVWLIYFTILIVSKFCVIYHRKPICIDSHVDRPKGVNWSSKLNKWLYEIKNVYRQLLYDTFSRNTTAMWKSNAHKFKQPFTFTQ